MGVTKHTNGHIDREKNGSSSPAAKKLKVGPKEELADFDKVFKILMEECLDENAASGDKEIGDAITHFLKVCKFQLHGGNYHAW